ncbi:MAG: ABC transporter ATP-binding protein [Christensenella sp.]|uniref:ABC transporter ATP-binding protein n=1 Tax=Christensenella sp. TaxID=1935934 RepID=UPI002B210D65|nr:ABC transporter ATP-binding protein [Christensenella sp.]MEA5004635.1 ABC transporter ATP-binding protein [Christensenella sp.]
MSKIAVSVQNVTKIYPLYDRKSDRLKEALSVGKRKRHKEFFALKNISFEVKEGECVGFVGKNGSGKSTLLKILTGVLTPSSGTYNTEGTISALLELGAGFNFEYTGIENIYLNGSVLGFSREEMDAKMQSILDFADIGDFVNQPVKMYSSGMFVRLAFAVAINVEPDILIVDEALSVGDIFFQQKCYKKFQDFKEAGKTILFVTHDMSSIIKYCNRAYLLNDGEVISNGAPKMIVDQYKKLIAGLDVQEETEEKTGDGSTTEKVTEWKASYGINPSCLEYGSKEAEIIDFGIFDSNGRIAVTCNKGNEYTIKMKVLFHQDVEEPIFAFTFKDIKGTEITGTNTDLEGIEIGVIKAGQIVEIAFRQSINLQGPQYFLSLGCTKYVENGELKIFHRLYDVINLNLVTEKVSVGYFDMNSEIEVSNEGEA